MASAPHATDHADLADLDKLYEKFDKAHGPEHQQAVREKARELAEVHAPSKAKLIDLAARLHDIGLSKGREHHEISGAEMVSDNPRFKSMPKRKLRLLVNAIRQHRASTGKPRSVIGKIISDADRVAGSDTAGALRRAIDYGHRHFPGLEKKEQYRRALKILYKKYHPKGEGRRHYFPETGKRLANIFDPIVAMHREDDTEGVGKYLQPTYDPPMGIKEIKNKGMKHLLSDPAHKWRAKTGIELIHKEPTLKELNRIWRNWQRGRTICPKPVSPPAWWL